MPTALVIPGTARCGSATQDPHAHHPGKRCRDPGLNWGPSDLRSDALPAELSRLLTLASKILSYAWARVVRVTSPCGPAAQAWFRLVLLPSVSWVVCRCLRCLGTPALQRHAPWWRGFNTSLPLRVHVLALWRCARGLRIDVLIVCSCAAGRQWWDYNKLRQYTADTCRWHAPPAEIAQL